MRATAVLWKLILFHSFSCNEKDVTLSILTSMFQVDLARLGGTRMSQLWILLELRVMEVVVTNTCKAPVKMSPPRNQHPVFYNSDALIVVAQPTVSEHWMEWRKVLLRYIIGFLGRLPKVDLIILEGGKCPSVRPSTKSFFDFNKIWYIGRGRWVIHDGMPYGRIQGQGQGHEPLKVWIPSIFKTYLLRHLQWELASDH